MTRTIVALLLILGQFPLAAAPRRRAVPSAPPYVPPAAIVAAATQAADAALKAGFPAVQIAVSQGGQIIYSDAFGITDREFEIAATPQSVMQIASVTKQFTAAAILRLADGGALKLDDRIEKFLPEFDARGATITLRHLLHHTSGVPEVGVPWSAIKLPMTREQFIKFIMNANPLAFQPGTRFSYNNWNYSLLSYVIESITGRSFADFIYHEIALPLGLIHTGVCGTSGLPLPVGYRLTAAGPVWQGPFDMSVSSGGGALCSTASDLARWSHLLATGRVILPASYEAMKTPAKLTNNTLVAYGLGVQVNPQLGRRAVHHAGRSPGFESYLIYFSDHDIAVAVILNAFPGEDLPARDIAFDVARAALPAQ